MPRVSLPTGVSLYYEVSGLGEPVLLIMGTGADHSMWDVTVPAYANRFRVITYDNRGTGQSDCPSDPESYRMRVLADDAAALLDVMGVERAHVSGLSLGSTVAQELAIEHPERVTSLQLHCTWGRTDEWLRRLFDGMAYPVERNDLKAFVRTAFMWVMSPTYLNERVDEVARIERDYLLENPHPPSRAGLLGHLHADRTHDSLDRLAHIRAATLITSGELDWQIPTRYGREVQARISGSRMHVFAGPHSSHMAYTEMAHEFNALSRDFLEEHAER
jgi:pimeloyl-ACP methyl ester carboxylesterase